MSAGKNYSIRALSPDDWQTYVTLRLQALEECPGVFGSNFQKEQKYTPEEWRSFFSSKDGAMFALFDGDEAIGITGVKLDKLLPGTGLFVASYIKPNYRGRGLSSFLYQARIDWACDNTDWTKLAVGHREGNESSRRANQRHGFVYTHSEPYNWPDGATADHLYYELDLEQMRQKQ